MLSPAGPPSLLTSGGSRRRVPAEMLAAAALTTGGDGVLIGRAVTGMYTDRHAESFDLLPIGATICET